MRRPGQGLLLPLLALASLPKPRPGPATGTLEEAQTGVRRLTGRVTLGECLYLCAPAALPYLTRLPPPSGRHLAVWREDGAAGAPGKGRGSPGGLQGESPVHAKPRMSRSRLEEVQEELPRCLRLEGFGTPTPPCPRNACSKTCFPWKLRVLLWPQGWLSCIAAECLGNDHRGS